MACEIVGSFGHDVVFSKKNYLKNDMILLQIKDLFHYPFLIPDEETENIFIKMNHMYIKLF